MRKMEFKKLKAQNFLCFGEKGIEIDLMATNFKAFSGS
jgi:hypothetical protein